MDWMIPFLGPALVATGVSGVISVACLIVTTKALRRRRAEELESDRALAERIFNFDRAMAEKHTAIDRTLAELKSKNDYDLSELNRMIELAEQAIVQFHQIKLTIDAARSLSSLGGEAGRRRPRPETEEDHELFVFGRVDHIIEEIKQICHPTMRGVVQ